MNEEQIRQLISDAIAEHSHDGNLSRQVNPSDLFGSPLDVLTTQDTSITHTAPGTPDFAIQDLVDSGVGSAFGFSSKDEGNTVLQVILNLQVRLAEVEARLEELGLVASN